MSVFADARPYLVVTAKRRKERQNEQETYTCIWRDSGGGDAYGPSRPWLRRSSRRLRWTSPDDAPWPCSYEAPPSCAASYASSSPSWRMGTWRTPLLARVRRRSCRRSPDRCDHRASGHHDACRDDGPRCGDACIHDAASLDSRRICRPDSAERHCSPCLAAGPLRIKADTRAVASRNLVMIWWGGWWTGRDLNPRPRDYEGRGKGGNYWGFCGRVGARHLIATLWLRVAGVI